MAKKKKYRRNGIESSLKELIATLQETNTVIRAAAEAKTAYDTTKSNLDDDRKQIDNIHNVRDAIAQEVNDLLKSGKIEPDQVDDTFRKLAVNKANAQALAMGMDNNLKPGSKVSEERRIELVHLSMKGRYGDGYDHSEFLRGFWYKLLKPWDGYISAGPGAKSYDDEVTELTRNMLALHKASNNTRDFIEKVLKVRRNERGALNTEEIKDLNKFISQFTNDTSLNASTPDGLEQVRQALLNLKDELDTVYTETNVDRHTRNTGLETRPFQEKGWALHTLLLVLALKQDWQTIKDMGKAFFGKLEPGETRRKYFAKGAYGIYKGMVLHASSMRRLNQAFLSRTEHPARTFLESSLKFIPFAILNSPGLVFNLGASAFSVLNPVVTFLPTIGRFGLRLAMRVLGAATMVYVGLPLAEKIPATYLSEITQTVERKIKPFVKPIGDKRKELNNAVYTKAEKYINNSIFLVRWPANFIWGTGILGKKIIDGVVTPVPHFWNGTRPNDSKEDIARNNIDRISTNFKNWSATEMWTMTLSNSANAPEYSQKIARGLTTARTQIAGEVKNIEALKAEEANADDPEKKAVPRSVTLDVIEDGSTPLLNNVFPKYNSQQVSCEESLALIHAYLSSAKQLVAKPDVDFQNFIKPRDLELTLNQLAREGCLGRPAGYVPQFIQQLSKN